MPLQDSYLFFATGGSMDSANEAHVYPLSNLRGIHPVNSTTLGLRFDPTFITDVAAGDATDLVTLTIKAGTFKRVVQTFFKTVSNNYQMHIIADSDNSEFITSDITDCSITLAT
tara:strand:- start:77 stop:418 length:342 start_codon:yes stop_codon:yes gene_type:complete